MISPTSPEDERPAPSETDNVSPRVVVKFHDDADRNMEGFELTQEFDDASVKEFSDRIRSVADRGRGLAGLNLQNFWSTEVGTAKQGLELAEKLRLRNDVEYAYLHPGPVEPPMVYADDDPKAGGQNYLDPAPIGIDARYAWTIAGGDGANQRFADVEWGWDIRHSDLPTNKISPFPPGLVHYYQAIPHGTNVLGVIAASDNTELCVGITPNIDSIVTVGQWRSPVDSVTHQAVLDAILRLNSGDVLLLEAQTHMFTHNNIPLEAETVVFELIEIATKWLDIVVVEAAGNGGVNLDIVQDNTGTCIFHRPTRDSGAIIVGSASPTSNPRWQRMNSSCYGNRVDCFGWGANVRTLCSNDAGTDHDGLTDFFNRTSAAAAIVAGAAISLQGAIEARYQSRLGAPGIRALLASPQLNTLSAYYGTDQIGVMPDLLSIINIFP